MLSIGEFSKICGVTTRTLRHYDDINLIKPKEINKESGYRFYHISQIREMLLINRLKAYDFSLNEIAEIIKLEDKKLIIEKISAKEKEFLSKVKDYENICKKIKSDILNLKKGIDIMSFINEIEVSLIETKPQYILHLRQYMSANDYGKYIGKLFEKAFSEKMKITGAPISIYHDKEFDAEHNDTEVALPVLEENQHTRILKGGLCATAVHKGAYSNLTSVYAKLIEWINENGYEVVAPSYEQYIKGPVDPSSQSNHEANNPNEDSFVTEIYFPVRKLK